LANLRWSRSFAALPAALIGENLPLKVVQEMARHASITTTLDVYGHLQPEAKVNAAQALEEAVWGRGTET